MAGKIKIASTCRRCGALLQNVTASAADAAIIEYIDSILQGVKARRPDLIVLPEMCDLPKGWEMAIYVQYIADRTEAVYEHVREKAQELNAWIAYPTVRQMEDKTFRNSCILIDREGKTALTYDKLHPTLGELEAGIRPGEAPRVLECELGRVGAAICFDLNYTDLALEYRKKNVDLLLFPSLFDGGLMQQMWAFTTRAYLVGACGGCCASVVSPAGEVLDRSTGYFPEIVCTANLDYELVHLDFNWDKLMELTGRYADSVTMRDPGGLGSVILLNESAGRTMKEILDEFQIERLDDYLGRMEHIKSCNEAKEYEL